MVAGLALLAFVSAPADSAMCSEDGSLTNFRSQFPLFCISGVVYGFTVGTFKSSKDMIDAMSKAMSGMAYSHLYWRFSVPCLLQLLVNLT